MYTTEIWNQIQLILRTACKNSDNLFKLAYCKEAGFLELWTSFKLWKAVWEVILADDRFFSLFWHTKINATAKEEFVCCFKSTDQRSSSARCFNRKEKKPLWSSSWKFWRQTLQTQVQQRSRMSTENDVRGSVTLKEKGFSFFFPVLKLKYLNTKVDKLTKQNYNI